MSGFSVHCRGRLDMGIASPNCLTFILCSFSNLRLAVLRDSTSRGLGKRSLDWLSLYMGFLGIEKFLFHIICTCFII